VQEKLARAPTSQGHGQGQTGGESESLGGGCISQTRKALRVHASKEAQTRPHPQALKNMFWSSTYCTTPLKRSTWQLAWCRGCSTHAHEPMCALGLYR
jgi:hypothetical protein